MCLYSKEAPRRMKTKVVYVVRRETYEGSEVCFSPFEDTCEWKLNQFNKAKPIPKEIPEFYEYGKEGYHVMLREKDCIDYIRDLNRSGKFEGKRIAIYKAIASNWILEGKIEGNCIGAFMDCAIVGNLKLVKQLQVQCLSVLSLRELILGWSS